MIGTRRKIIAALIVCLMPWAAHAAAPVVDESDNFSTYDQDQAADEQPLAHDRSFNTRDTRELSDNNFADDRPLAHESSRPQSGNNASLLTQIQGMQKEIQELRGQIEVQNHDIKVLKEQQLTFYKDLDARIHKAPTTPAQVSAVVLPDHPKPAAVPPTQPSVPHSETIVPATMAPERSNNPAEEQIHYLAAYDLIKNKHFNDAIPAMQSFVAQYPNGGYTANAHYWLGELYMTQKDFIKAITQFDIVLSQFPASSKSAPSLLKSAYALASSGKKQEAIVRLKQVIKQYPDTQTAQMAEVKLKSLNR